MAVKLLGSLTTSAELSVEDNLYLTDAGTVRGKIELNATDRDDVDIKATSLGSNMKFFTVNTERMRINDYGAVLIGTSNTNGGKADFAVGSPQISWYSGQIQIGGTDMNWNAKGYVDSGIFNLAAWDGHIRLFTQGSSSATSKDIILSPQATGGSVTERVRLKGDTGNFGIGTNAPLEKLHVVGKINSSNNIVSNSTYTMFTGRSSRTTDNYGGLNKEYFKANLVTPGPNTTGESSAHGIADLRFQLANSAGNTNMSDIMTLRSAGNVGIGTTSPQKKLDVYLGTDSAVASVAGTISAGEYAGLHFGYSEAGNSNYRHSAIVFERDDASHGDARGKIHILNSASGSASADLGDSRLTILPSGNVGIGTTSPAQKLHVVGNQVRLDTAAGGYYLYNTSGTFRGAFYDNGTTTDIFGDGNGSTAAISIDSGNSTFAGNITSPNLNVGNAIYHDGDNNTYIWFTTDRIRIDAGGVNKFDSNNTYVIDSAPAAPTNLSLSVVNDTINVTFTASATSGIDSYFVFSSVDGGDYSLISMVAPDDFGATMSIIDNSFDATGTQAYRVYAVKNGIISADLAGSISYSVTSPLEPTNMSVVNLNTAFYIQWDAPSSNARFVSVYNVYKHEHATESSLARNSATLIYSGNNYNYMYQISGGDNNNFHKFWVETTIA